MAAPGAVGKVSYEGKLLERLRRRAVVDEASGCWLYMGAANPRGGHCPMPIKRGGIRRTGFAHRVGYELLVGPIPDGLKVLHRCDVGRCFNPSHLFLGTQGDNARDMAAKGRGYIASGENQHMAKLTWTKVAVIRSRKRFLGCNAVWAKEFGVSERTIHGVLRGDTWTKECRHRNWRKRSNG